MSTDTNIPKSIDEAIRQHRRDITIPIQLRDCRFIKLLNRSKMPAGEGFFNNPYEYNDPELLNHINNMGENYGVILKNGVCCFDCDSEKLFLSLPARLIDNTFIVKSGRDDGGYHVYFKCLDAPPIKVVLADAEGGALGDVRFSGHRSQLVGPGSIHNASGKQYRVFRDKPLYEIGYDEIRTIIKRFTNDLDAEETKAQEAIFNEVRKRTSRNHNTRSISEQYDLRVESFLYPDNPTQSGAVIRGCHPVHGSETGHNLEIDTSKNVWYCFRCNAGGGPIEAYAVSRGIIQCREAKSGQFTKDQWHAILGGLEAEGICKFPSLSPANRTGEALRIDREHEFRRDCRKITEHSEIVAFLENYMKNKKTKNKTGEFTS